jgi:hypothetical protein
MEKVKYYADLFGGTLQKMLEFKEDTLSSAYLDKALRQLDACMESKFVVPMDEDVLNWLNSNVLDKIINSNHIFINCCQYGYLSLAKQIYLTTRDSNLRSLAFHLACECGHLPVAQWLSEFEDNDYVREIKGFTFQRTCENGHLLVAQWLYLVGDVNKVYINRAFCSACANGYLLIAQWLYQEVELDYSRYNPTNDAFFQACINGHLSIAQWLKSLGKITDDNIYEKVFSLACYHGHLSIAQWLYLECGSHPHYYNDQAFIWACYHDHLDVVQWLYGLGGIDIHANNDSIFVYSCHHGHMSIAQWLYGLGGIGDNIIYDTFVTTCRIKGRLPMTKWLHGIGHIDVHRDDDKAFYRACIYGVVDTAQWLYSFGGFHDDFCNNVFPIVCKCGHLEAAQWLYGLGIIDVHHDRNAAFRLASEDKRSNVVDWLRSLCNKRRFKGVVDKMHVCKAREL